MPLNLGAVNFQLGADTKNLDAAVNAIRRFGQTVQAASAVAGRGATQTAAAYRRQEQAAISALQSTLRMNDQIRRSVTGKPRATLLKETTTAFRQFNNQMTKGQLNALQYQRAMETLQIRMGGVSRALARVKAAQQGANTFGMAMKDLASTTVLAIGPLSGLGARVAAFASISNRSGLAVAALAGGLAALGAGFYMISTRVFQTNLSLERIRKRLEGMTGNITLAEIEFDKLRDMSDRTGIQFVKLATQFTRFQAASRGTSLEGARTSKIFENIAYAVGQFQLDSASAEGVFRAVEQIMSKGTVTAEELRQQLGDRLPGAFKAAADAMGVTTAKLNKLLKAGKISSEKFLLPFSEQIKKSLASGLVGSVDSTQASINRLANAVTNFHDKMNKTFRISSVAKSGMENLTSVINFLAEHIRGVSIAAGALTATLGLIVAPKVLGGLNTLSVGFTRLGAAIFGVNTALAASPVGKVVTILARLAIIIGGAVAAYYLFRSSTAQAAEAEQKLRTEADLLIQAHKDQKKVATETANKYVDAARVKLSALKKELETLREVNEAQKKFIKDYDESSKKWYQRDIGEIFARFFIGAKQRHGQVKEQMDAVSESIKGVEERIQALTKLKESGSLGNFGLGDDEGLDKAGKALRKATNSIKDLMDINAAMMKGPKALAEFTAQAEDLQKIRSMTEHLRDAGVATDEITVKINQYTMALEYNRMITNTTFKNIKATYEGYKSIISETFTSMADNIASAIMKSELSMKTFKDSFRSLVQQIIAMTLKLAVVNPILNSIFGVAGTGAASGTFSLGGLGKIFSGIFGAKGLAFNSGVRMLSQGGILNGPTLFGTSRGLAIGGEADTEAVVPLVRGSNGNLGVQAFGSGSVGAATTSSPRYSDRNVIINFNVKSPDAKSFFRSETQVAAMMQRALSRGQRNM